MILFIKILKIVLLGLIALSLTLFLIGGISVENVRKVISSLLSIILMSEITITILLIIAVIIKSIIKIWGTI